MPILLAHGALGAWDEVIFLGIAVIFMGMMVFSWLNSRRAGDEDEQEHFELE